MQEPPTLQPFNPVPSKIGYHDIEGTIMVTQKAQTVLDDLDDAPGTMPLPMQVLPT